MLLLLQAFIQHVVQPLGRAEMQYMLLHHVQRHAARFQNCDIHAVAAVEDKFI